MELEGSVRCRWAVRAVMSIASGTHNGPASVDDVPDCAHDNGSSTCIQACSSGAPLVAGLSLLCSKLTVAGS